MTVKFTKIGHRPDYFLFGLIALLVISGLVILASASSDLGKIKFNNAYYYINHQILYGLSLGILGFFLGYKIHYQFYKKLAFVLLLLNLILLIMVFSPFGRTAGGASRWLDFGPLSFQPSELLKLSFIIYLAAWLTNPKVNRSQNVWEGIVPFFMICAIIGGILILQPATSTVVILISSGLVMFFVSGAPFKYILAGIMMGAVLFGLVIYSSPYRWQRVMTFLGGEKDSQGSGYQVNQAKIAIGSGGIWGMGYGESPSKYSTLPTPIDDSIFAVAAQELGFVGAGGLVLLFGMLVFRLLWMAKNMRDKFGHYILIGFAAIIAFQSLVNMGAISGLLPLTGIPLPFISYGGTALAVFMTIGGISLNISKYS